jgi:peptidoglycan/xylan/chitin deacetylase (PgdA/CDA1 family)
MRSGGTCQVAIALAAAGLCWSAGPGVAQTRSLLDSCWTPAALAAKLGENVPVKRDHHFDAALQAAPLATFAPLSYAPNGVVRGVSLPPGRKLIALTFDLCEQPGEVAGYDGAIVDYLRKEHVKATFFAGGKWLRSHEERARQLMADPLFEIGNHAEAHRNLRELDGERLTAEIAGPQRAYEAIRERLVATQCVKAASGDMPPIAPRMGLFRFPYGACNDRALQAVRDQGLRAIQWDLATGDPAPLQSAKAIARLLTARVRPGSIIVGHANGKGWHTAEALPLAIPKLRSMGFEFVTVSELLAAGKPVIAQTCYDTHPGDVDRYDILAAHDHPLVRHPAIPKK